VDDEGIYDQVGNKHCSVTHMRQAQSTLTKEIRKRYCYRKLSFENNRIHCSSSIVHTEIGQNTFDSSLKLYKSQWSGRMKKLVGIEPKGRL
jgi:hypothetical protein